MQEDVDLHEDDVPLPQPTADRDRLQSDLANKRFFNLVKSVVKERELEVAAEFMEHIDGSDDVFQAPQDHPGEWRTFRNIVRKQGPHSVQSNLRRMTRCFHREDNQFRTYDEELTIEEWKHRCNCIKNYTDDDPIEVVGNYDIPEVYQRIFGLFKEFSHCPRNSSRGKKKKGRNSEKLGNLLADSSGSKIYMAASTGGKFYHRAKVVWNTYSDGEVIVVDGVNKYEKYNDMYGFGVLKNVPYRESDNEDDEWDIPAGIAEKNRRTKGKSKDNNGKPDDVEEHILKIRTDDSHSIDYRLTVSDIREKLTSGTIGGKSEMVLFPRTIEQNISDNYNFADHAAIASCSNEEYEALADHDDVWLPEAYAERSYGTALATTEGAMTIRALLDDDRQVILAHARDTEDKKLIADDMEKLREYFTEDLQSQQYWDNDEPPEVLWAVADRKTYNRLKYAFSDQYVSRENMIKFKYGASHGRVLSSYTLNKSEEHYQRLMDTPNWDDDSQIYNVIDSLSYNKGHSGHIEELIMALHDLNLDLTTMEESEVRDAVALMCGSGDN